MRIWDAKALSFSGSSREMLCGTAGSDQEMPCVLSCPLHPGLSSGVSMVSQRPLPVLFVFLAKQGPAESEARVGLCSVLLYILRHRLQDCVLKKPPMWAPPLPPRSNIWIPLVKPLPSANPQGFSLYGHCMRIHDAWVKGVEPVVGEGEPSPINLLMSSDTCSLPTSCAWLVCHPLPSPTPQPCPYLPCFPCPAY